MKVKEICDLQNGRAFKPKDWGTEGLPIIRIQNLNDENAPFNYYSGSYSPVHEVNDGELLFSWSGTPGTSFGAFRWYRGKGVLNQHIFRVLPKIEVDKEYLKYALNGNINSIIAKSHGGVGLQHITKKELDEIDIPIVPLTEQAAIVGKIARVERVIAMRKRELQKLDDLIKARFVEMFGDPIINPNAYKRITLNDACTKVTDGTHDTPERYEEGVLLLTGKNIRATGITFDDVEYVSEEDHRIIYDRCNPEYGDVLYTNIGVNYGTACFNNLDYEFSMKNVALLKPKRELLDGHYLWICLNYMRDYILSQNQVGGAQTFMGLATIKKISIPVPSINLQKQFVEFLVQIDKSKVAVQKALDETQLLFDSLMQQYFG